MNKIIQIAILILSISFNALAIKGDEGKKEKEPIAPANTATSMRGTRIAAENVLKKEALTALNAQLSGVNISRSAIFSPSKTFLKDNIVTTAVADGRKEAFDLFALLDSKGYLNGDQRQTAPLVAERMPMGLKQHFGANNTVYIGFSKIVMNSQYAELTAFIKMEMMVDDGQTGTKKKKELFFGAKR